jgi:alpha-1,4-digalacturonate transport system permease protein
MRRRKLSVVPYLYILPVFAIFGLFIIWPALEGFFQSLFRRGIIVRPDITTLRATFIGLENYAQLFRDPRFYTALRNTFAYTMLAVPLTIVVSLGVAVFLRDKFTGIGVARALIYWPSMISPIIIGIAWRWIFGYETGILNFLIRLVGGKSVPWLIDGSHAFASIILVSVWAQTGFFMVIFIGGLNAIPEEYYEAASIDGASWPQRFLRITLPLLKPTTLLVLVLTTINALKVYQQVVVLTEGGPGRATVFLVQNIYEEAFTRPFGVGYASAQSFAFFLMVLLLSLFQFKLMQEER